MIPSTRRWKPSYFKGSKRRREYSRDKPSKMKFVSISRCDERKRIVLNEDARLYAELPIIDWSEQRKRARPLPPTEMTGAEVTDHNRLDRHR